MIEKAIEVATEAHRGQKRKGSGIPYTSSVVCKVPYWPKPLLR